MYSKDQMTTITLDIDVDHKTQQILQHFLSQKAKLFLKQNKNLENVSIEYFTQQEEKKLETSKNYKKLKDLMDQANI